jgi:hypothetical protein
MFDDIALQDIDDFGDYGDYANLDGLLDFEHSPTMDELYAETCLAEEIEFLHSIGGLTIFETGC